MRGVDASIPCFREDDFEGYRICGLGVVPVFAMIKSPRFWGWRIEYGDAPYLNYRGQYNTGNEAILGWLGSGVSALISKEPLMYSAVPLVQGCATNIGGVKPLISSVAGKPRFPAVDAEKSKMDLFSDSLIKVGQEPRVFLPNRD